MALSCNAKSYLSVDGIIGTNAGNDPLEDLLKRPRLRIIRYLGSKEIRMTATHGEQRTTEGGQHDEG